MLHCYIIITCSKRTRLVAVRTPHSTQFFRLVQREGAKRPGRSYLHSYVQYVSFTHYEEKKIYTAKTNFNSKTYHRCQEKKQTKKTTKKIDNK